MRAVAGARRHPDGVQLIRAPGDFYLIRRGSVLEARYRAEGAGAEPYFTLLRIRLQNEPAVPQQHEAQDHVNAERLLSEREGLRDPEADGVQSHGR